MSTSTFANATIGFGTMSLCITKDRPGEDESVRMIEDLIDRDGLTFIDTADSYCLNENDFGYGERIVAKFASDPRVTIATKGGFTRPNGSWKPRGDPKYLRSACEASLRRLGVETIELYQFHTPDEGVSYADSIGELVRLRDEGKIKNIGVSNASIDQLTLAKEMADVHSIQNPLSILFYNAESMEAYDSIFRYCESNAITFIAYAPLGGFRNPYVLPTISPELNLLAESQHVTTYQLGLLALRALSPCIVPIPGSKSKKHIMENLAIRNLSLSDEALNRIAEIMELPEGHRFFEKK